MNLQEQIIEIVEKNNVKFDMLNANAHPTDKQINNAIKSFATDANNADIIAISDTTMFKSGKKGFVFTSEGVYASDIDFCVDKNLRTTQPIRYDQVVQMRIEDKHNIVFTYKDGSYSIGYFSIYADYFYECFTMIQSLINTTESISQDYDLTQELKDGSTLPLKIRDTYRENGHTYIFTTGILDGTITPFLYEIINNSYVFISDNEKVHYLVGKFLDQNPTLLQLFNDKKEEKPVSKEQNDSEELDNFIMLSDPDGNTSRFEFLDLIHYQEKDYVVLLPDGDEDTKDVVILQVEESYGDYESYIAVDSDETLITVFEIFKEKFSNEFDFKDQEKQNTEEIENNRPIPYEGDEPYIFISYAHRDMDTVLPIIHQMRKDGYRVWYDEGIDPGSEWDENIASHLEKSRCFIAFMSENYLQSNNCKDEIFYARDLEMNCILVYIDDAKLKGGMAMRLNRLQALFYHKYQLKPLFFKRLYEAGVITTCGVKK